MSLESKRVSAAEAVGAIESGQRILVGSGCAEPQSLVRALCARAPHLHDIEIVHMMTLGLADYVDVGFMDHFRHNAFFIGSNVRRAVREGRADYTPVFLSEIPELISSGQRRIDAVLLQLSPPDRHGYCSMGIHVDIQHAATRSARLVIAEINPNMPRTFGDTLVHIDEIDAITEVDSPLLELPTDEADETSLQIGAHVARLIDDGSCLQMGIGGIPNAVLSLLSTKRHLGIHTEMFSDGVLPLFESGAIDNSMKALHTGITVTSFTMGSKRLYEFVDDNPSISYFASDYVNSPRTIAQNDQVVAINSALQLDLTGQVCADSLGYTFYSGIGGQVDFIRGAAMSRGGKPIIAMPSTAKGGTLSRIVAHLDEGAGVVTSRGDVHYVATEFGVAYLHGKTIRERSMALINIAHPDFRKELIEHVKNKHYVYADERVWQQAVNTYPTSWEHTRKFGDSTLLVRPLKATDERHLQEFFYTHAPETIYHRYFFPKKSLGHREASELCCVDYAQRMAFAVFHKIGEAKEMVAVGRYELNPRTNRAETALVVGEDWQGRGIATYLLEQLIAFAAERNIDGCFSEILPSNAAMLHIHRKLGHVVAYDAEEEVYRIEISIDQRARAPGNPVESEA